MGEKRFISISLRLGTLALDQHFSHWCSKHAKLTQTSNSKKQTHAPLRKTFPAPDFQALTRLEALKPCWTILFLHAAETKQGRRHSVNSLFMYFKGMDLENGLQRGAETTWHRFTSLTFFFIPSGPLDPRLNLFFRFRALAWGLRAVTRFPSLLRHYGAVCRRALGLLFLWKPSKPIETSRLFTLAYNQWLLIYYTLTLHVTRWVSCPTFLFILDVSCVL